MHFKTYIQLASEEKKCFHCGCDKPRVKWLAFGVNKILVQDYDHDYKEDLYNNYKNALIDLDTKNSKGLLKKEYDLSIY